MKFRRILSVILSVVMLTAVVSFEAAAEEKYMTMNFESMADFADKFVPGAFYVEDGTLFGYDEARALQTKYVEEYDMLVDTDTTWLTYDAVMTLSIAEDDMRTNQVRHFELAYCNDNLYNLGRAEGRVYMSFAYDIDAGCFRLVTGLEGTADAEQILPPVYMDIPTDGEEFFTIGISVEKGRMRCFYNGKLIYNLDDPSYMIADEITSPFLFWQRGNFLQCTNITVAEQGTIFSASTPGDATGDGKVNLADVSLILKHIAKWDVTPDLGAADVTGDSKVNLADVSLILKYIAKWDVTLK